MQRPFGLVHRETKGKFSKRYLFHLFRKRYSSENILLEKKNDEYSSVLKKKQEDLILYKFYSVENYKINDIINVLNMYIKLKNENVELLRNISIHLLMNKDKLRYTDIIILVKKFSIIKCKNYFLFGFFKDVLTANLHLLNIEELINVYFSFTNLNYFHYNFYFLIEKKIFHNFHLVDLKNLVFLIQCFNKKKIITKNYLTILLYSISKNINKCNSFHLSVIFSFIINFNVTNNILLTSLIHQFTHHFSLNDSAQSVALFYNLLSYLNRKCRNTEGQIEKKKDILLAIKNATLKWTCESKEEGEKICGRNLQEDAKKWNQNNSVIVDKSFAENEGLNELIQKVDGLKKSLNYNLLYIVKNSLKSLEDFTKKKIKHMPIQSLCVLAAAMSNIEKNKFLFEKIGEEIGKQSTNLTPALVSYFMLSFSKVSHKHGSLIYFSLQFFYKFSHFFNLNEVGLLCKSLQMFSVRENEFINCLNDFLLNRIDINNTYVESTEEEIEKIETEKIEKMKTHVEPLEKGTEQTDSLIYIQYESDAGDTSKDTDTLFHEVEKSIGLNEKKGSSRYEDVFKNLKEQIKDNIEKGDIRRNERESLHEDLKKDINLVNFSFIDYTQIKMSKYHPNCLYNVKINKTTYLNNIIYILEYYAFNLVANTQVLDMLCAIFLKKQFLLNYILYSRILYAFYVLRYNELGVYKIIELMDKRQPLNQPMFKKKHMEQLLEALLYFYEAKKEKKETEKNEKNTNSQHEKNSFDMDIYFYVLQKKMFFFLFQFPKYMFTFLFIKNNISLFRSIKVHIKNIRVSDDYIYIHKPKGLY